MNRDLLGEVLLEAADTFTAVLPSCVCLLTARTPESLPISVVRSQWAARTIFGSDPDALLFDFRQQTGATVPYAVCLPLTPGGEFLGSVRIHVEEAAYLPDPDSEPLQALRELTARTLQQTVRAGRLEEEATLDPKTGVRSYGYLLSRLDEEIRHAARDLGPLSLIATDINGLKAINDTHGLLVGDHVIRRVASILMEPLRGRDLVARNSHAADEFFILLADTGREATLRFARERQRRIATTPLSLTTRRGKTIELPVSIAAGVATYPNDGPEPADLIYAASERMKAAKRQWYRRHPLQAVRK